MTILLDCPTLNISNAPGKTFMNTADAPLKTAAHSAGRAPAARGGRAHADDRAGAVVHRELEHALRELPARELLVEDLRGRKPADRNHKAVANLAHSR